MALSPDTFTMSKCASAAVETPLFLGTAPSSSSRRLPTLRISPVRATAFDASLCVDHHATLGVSFGASKLEIKRAYRRLARQFHPDVCKTSRSDQIFKHINHAYESLMSRSTSGARPAASSASIFSSEAGYWNLEELLYGSALEVEERYWTVGEDAYDNSFIDYRWLEADALQESMDASLFTTAAEEEADVEAPWLRC